MGPVCQMVLFQSRVPATLQICQISPLNSTCPSPISLKILYSAILFVFQVTPTGNSTNNGTRQMQVCLVDSGNDYKYSSVGFVEIFNIITMQDTCFFGTEAFDGVYLLFLTNRMICNQCYFEIMVRQHHYHSCFVLSGQPA